MNFLSDIMIDALRFFSFFGGYGWGIVWLTIAVNLALYPLTLSSIKSMGAMRGIGWVVLYYDKIAERLFNVWINEHDVGHLAGAAPLLVIDVFEHAYMIDYGLKRTDYIEAFFKIIDWEAAIKRF